MGSGGPVLSGDASAPPVEARDCVTSMNLGLSLLGLILGLVVLSVVFRLAGLTGPNPRERPPRWLLIVGIVTMAIGFVLLVIAARSGR
jgi:drug/metabolite transporter (DMT)-like permease